MKNIRCDECGKVIEGYTDDQCRWLLSQHKLKHMVDREKKLLKDEN